jgi:hypothetical protein
MSEPIAFYRPMQDEGDVWREESWTANGGSHIPHQIFDPYEVSTCTYIDGRHVISGRHCPHYNGVDDFNS